MFCSMAQHTIYPRECSLGTQECTWEECISYYDGRDLLEVSVRSSWLVVLFKSSYFLFDFLSGYSAIIESRILKSSSVIVELSISVFISVSFCLLYFGPLLLVAYVYNYYIFLIDWPHFYYKVSFFVSSNISCFRVYFI